MSRSAAAVLHVSCLDGYFSCFCWCAWHMLPVRHSCFQFSLVGFVAKRCIWCIRIGSDVPFIRITRGIIGNLLLVCRERREIMSAKQGEVTCRSSRSPRCTAFVGLTSLARFRRTASCREGEPFAHVGQALHQDASCGRCHGCVLLFFVPR